MKNKLVVAIFLVFTLPMFAQKYIGDVNRDGKINVGDITEMTYTALGMQEPEEDNSSKNYIDSLFSIMQNKVDSLSARTVALEKSLEEEKNINANLYNYKTATPLKFIYGKNGNINDVAWSQTIGVSDYIPVNGNDIITNSRVGQDVGSINVYDSEKKLLRTQIDNPQYLYKKGDAYIRIAFENYQRGQANYGTELLPYEDYVDIYATTPKEYNKNISSLYDKISSLEKLVEDLYGMDYTCNLYDKSRATLNKFIWAVNGNINDASWNKTIGVSDYINVCGHDIITNARIGEGVGSINVYDANKRLLRTIVNERQYIFQNGDVYIRVAYDQYEKGQANYGRKLAAYKDYSESYAMQTRIHGIYGKAAVSWIDDDFSYYSTYTPVYDKVLSWCRDNNVYPDIAFTPTVSDDDLMKVRVSKLKEWQEIGSHVLLHPVHEGWYVEPNGLFVRNEASIKSNLIGCIQTFKTYGIPETKVLVYPGSSGDDSATVNFVKNYVECAICWDNGSVTNHLTDHNRYQLRRVNIQPSANHTKTQIKEAIKNAIENGDWVILGGHIWNFTISDKLDETSMTTANLFDIISYANDLCKVKSAEVVWNERKLMFELDGK